MNGSKKQDQNLIQVKKRIALYAEYICLYRMLTISRLWPNLTGFQEAEKDAMAKIVAAGVTNV